MAEGQLEVLEKAWLSDQLSSQQLHNHRQAISHLHPAELLPQTWRQLNTKGASCVPFIRHDPKIQDQVIPKWQDLCLYNLTIPRAQLGDSTRQGMDTGTVG